MQTYSPSGCLTEAVKSVLLLCSDASSYQHGEPQETGGCSYSTNSLPKVLVCDINEAIWSRGQSAPFPLSFVTLVYHLVGS